MKTKFILLFIYLFSMNTRAQTVMDIIANSPDHNTLEAAITAANLSSTLQSSGPFTVFAPTDAAFAALPAGTVQALLADPEGTLKEILLYHVVGAKALASDLSNGQFIKTVNGKSVSISLTGGPKVNAANITVTDIAASNGVVHVIDGVILPPTTVVDVLVNSPVHKTLVAAVSAAGLVPTLQGAGPFTVFAPTDDAFGILPEGTIEALLADPQGLLTKILTYHVHGGSAKSADLSDGQYVLTVNGKYLKVNIESGKVLINGVQVIAADIIAENGVIHVIDAVLLPGNSLFDIIAASPQHTVLETAILASGLTDLLYSEELTIFAPDDAAFASLPAGTVESLIQNPTALQNILKRHIIFEGYNSSDFNENFDEPIYLNNLGGATSVIVNDGSLKVDGRTIVLADLEAENGYVHVINGVILPIDSTILDVVKNSSVHNVLETLLNAADLDGVSFNQVLESYGPFTFFAPVDGAFSGFTPEQVSELLNNPEDLIEILAPHLVFGKIKAADLYNGMLIRTLGETTLKVKISPDGAFINNAKVVVADINTDNGIVHAIDQVIIATRTSVMDVINSSQIHTTLQAAIRAANLDVVLSNLDNNFTIFAPTDAAFAALPAGTVEALLADPQGQLTRVLTYHAIAGETSSSSLSNAQFIKTINGKSVSVKIENGKVFINNAQVIVADLFADNGIVHVIDAVLLPPSTIVDVLVNSPVHKTLVAAVTAAQLVPTLQSAGPFTVFAPTDAAFAALPAGTIETLLADPGGLLTRILTYHAVAGSAKSTDLSNGQFVKTVNGKSVSVKIENGKVFINNAQVTTADVIADNGVVHIIDAVLLPPSNIVDVLVNSPVHKTLVAAVTAAQLVPTLQSAGPFTVFAPTDAAFAALPAGTIETLLADPSGLLTRILTYHAVAGSAKSTDLSNGQFVKTVNGKSVSVKIENGKVFINNAQVTTADVIADNGIVHIIDAVLLPPSTIVDVLVNSPVHKTLVTAVSAAQLVPALKGAGPFTVFAPTDAAFAALPAGTIETLLADPAGLLTRILTYHAIAGAAVKSTDLIDGQTAVTLNGNVINVKLTNGKVFINNAEVIVADVLADNGIVHVIDAVLLPPSSVEDDLLNEEVSVGPNPFNNQINIDYISEKVGDLNIDIYNVSGQKIFSGKTNASTSIRLTQNSGTYYLKLTNKNRSITKKMMLVE